MIGEEIEVVAEELAKSGGLSWYPGHTPGPLMRLVTDHHREQARVVIAALERLRAGEDSCWASDLQRAGPQETIHRGPVSEVRPGATIIYRPPGDQRASGLLGFYCSDLCRMDFHRKPSSFGGRRGPEQLNTSPCAGSRRITHEDCDWGSRSRPLPCSRSDEELLRGRA